MLSCSAIVALFASLRTVLWSDSGRGHGNQSPRWTPTKHIAPLRLYKPRIFGSASLGSPRDKAECVLTPPLLSRSISAGIDRVARQGIRSVGDKRSVHTVTCRQGVVSILFSQLCCCTRSARRPSISMSGKRAAVVIRTQFVVYA